MQLATLLAICFAIAAGAFALQNNSPVVVHVFFWTLESSLALVLLATLALGALILALVSTPAVLRDRWQLGRQKKRIGELERLCERQGMEMAGLAARLPEARPVQDELQEEPAPETPAPASEDSAPRA
ncbi:lipopolysaccharide assembly protein LapA domain-containing protein [Azovibrio restrictus]|uniref:lipopolysaccharide assembly protein LapA domain-containing protein n=1 Tax=Azovibrio restrictus TaxID=146938 RepID=UPI000424B964|nr:lipopolysaccharide assembly protein LapA domain-containing protein [Azovibrio restrictus]